MFITEYVAHTMAPKDLYKDIYCLNQLETK